MVPGSLVFLGVFLKANQTDTNVVDIVVDNRKSNEIQLKFIFEDEMAIDDSNIKSLISILLGYECVYNSDIDYNESYPEIIVSKKLTKLIYFCNTNKKEIGKIETITEEINPIFIQLSIANNLENFFAQMIPSVWMFSIFHPFFRISIKVVSGLWILNIPQIKQTYDFGVKNRVHQFTQYLYGNHSYLIKSHHCESNRINGFCDTIIELISLPLEPSIYIYLFKNGIHKLYMENEIVKIVRNIKWNSISLSVKPNEFIIQNDLSLNAYPFCFKAKILGSHCFSINLFIDCDSFDNFGIISKAVEGVFEDLKSDIPSLFNIKGQNPRYVSCWSIIPSIEESIESILNDCWTYDEKDSIRKRRIWNYLCKIV